MTVRKTPPPRRRPTSQLGRCHDHRAGPIRWCRSASGPSSLQRMRRRRVARRCRSSRSASSSRPTRRTRNTSCSRPAATLNARERSGDATSSDERRRDSEARAKPVLRSSTSALLREPARLRERCRWLALSPERRAQRRRVSRTGAGASRYCPRCEPLLPTLPMGGVVPHQNPLHKLRDRDRRTHAAH